MAQKPDNLEIERMLELGETHFGAVDGATWAFYNAHHRKPDNQTEMIEGVKLFVADLLHQVDEREGELAELVAQTRNVQLLALRLEGLEPGYRLEAPPEGQDE